MSGGAGQVRLRTRWGRAAVLALLCAGFLTMHGFVAVSASGTEVGHAAAAVHSAAQPSAQHLPAAPSTPGGSGHEPLDHHGLLAGCVVALVGVALLILAGSLLVRLRAATGHRVRAPLSLSSAARVLLLLRPPGLPRVALCVIRV